MPRVLLPTAIALAMLAVPALGRVEAQATGPAPRIEVTECQKRVAAGHTIIVDVRDAAAYNAGHIAGALSIPLDGVAAKADELKKGGKAIVAYCG